MDTLPSDGIIAFLGISIVALFVYIVAQMATIRVLRDLLMARDREHAKYFSREAVKADATYAYDGHGGAKEDEPPVVIDGADDETYAYDFINHVFGMIKRARDIAADLPWTPKECLAFREHQALLLARQNPDWDRGLQFESAVDSMVENAMWQACPRGEPEQVPCVICTEPSTNLVDIGWVCSAHYVKYVEAKEAKMLNPESLSMVSEPVFKSEKPQNNGTGGDAFLNLIRGD